MSEVHISKSRKMTTLQSAWPDATGAKSECNLFDIASNQINVKSLEITL